MSDVENTQKESPRKRIETLGMAGRMAQRFIHSPLSPLLLIAMLALGVLGLVFTPRQEDPQISVPMVDIMVQYPGASAEQVTTLVSEPLESLMSDITGVKHVYSASRKGASIITVQFDVGEDLQESLIKLHDKIVSNRDKIPPGVSQPLIKPKAVDDVPVVTLTLWSDDIDDASMRLLGLDILKKIKEVPNTSKSFIVGGRKEQIRIEAQPEKLSAYGISLDQLAMTIRTANSEKSVGSIESSNRTFQVFTGAFLRSADDVGGLVVSTFNGASIYVRDVARISHQPEDAKQLVEYTQGPAYAGDVAINSREGSPAVTLAIAKKYASNGVDVAAQILEKVESLKGVLIPENVNVEVTRNYGETANEKVNGLILKLFVATAVVTALVWWTLGSRAATVVLIVIPVVILFTVFGAWFMGFTIDRVSLFALIFSIGILVDDAIVVVENIYRRWLIKGDMDTSTSIDAVREVGNPTILATLTVIAALLPMGFVSGMMGPYMAPIPALGSFAMLCSLFAAFIFTPWLVMRLRPTMAYLEKAEVKEHRFNQAMDTLYRRLLLPLVESSVKGWLFLFAIIVAFFLSCFLFYTTAVTAKMLPLDNKPEFNIQINMDEGTALPVTANAVKRLSSALQQIDEVTALQSYVGTASPFNFNGLVRHSYLRDQPWQADIQVQLTHKSQRKASSHELSVLARELLTPIASELGFNIEVVEMPPGPPVLQSIVAEVYGPDAKTRRIVANDLTQIFASSDILTDVDNLMQEPYEMRRFVIDTEKSVRLGISVDAINRNLEMALGEYVVGDVKEGYVSEPTFIVLQVPLENRSDLSQIGNLPIMSKEGYSVPLSELGEFEADVLDHVIYHKDLRPVEFVTAEVQGRLASPIYGMLDVEDKLKDYIAPDGVALESEYFGPPSSGSKSGFEWTGEWTVTFETFRDMGMAFAAAIILIYMLVVWEFGSFLIPAIIISPIPLTLIGIIPGHWLLGAEFTATSMIGFIALAGIIVRNSILLVDFSRDQILSGVEPVEAIINSCKARTRPILITAGALMGGAVVILSDPIFKGMAISLFFGVLVATLLTLLIIPLGCVSAKNALIPQGYKGEGSLDTRTDNDTEKSQTSIASTAIRVLVSVLSAIGLALSAVMEFTGQVLQQFLEVSNRAIAFIKRIASTPSSDVNKNAPVVINEAPAEPPQTTQPFTNNQGHSQRQTDPDTTKPSKVEKAKKTANSDVKRKKKAADPKPVVSVKRMKTKKNAKSKKNVTTKRSGKLVIESSRTKKLSTKKAGSRHGIKLKPD